MGVRISIGVRRTARGKVYPVETEVAPGTEAFFNLPYDRKLHHRAVLDSLRSLLRKPGRFNPRSPETARAWQTAVLRDSPILKGFFAEEPQWREKILRWCESVLTSKQVSSQE